MLPTSAGVEPATSWSPAGRRIQLSHRGRLLVYIRVNDIVRNINSSIRLFADDTSLYIIVENPQSAARSLI